ncbi:hypothetical protein [Halalkalibacter sp. APA_J-10(15)]|uniref:hypothetical protein n=1 Tax=Halalkalibacter sp. APA_J-10(15) TaxID=2933805 RepID=UPI001FF1E422|nr:hypothetical protein [Halalkalibacter sp. APA_J-10(15)]MCK0473725.1 hypothetical protein [Halalkalibacter sp. APA_J-10(15)]
MINWNFEMNMIGVASTILAWVILAVLIRGTYNTQNSDERPKLWKIIIAVLIGLFSFSINLTLFSELFSIAILPLGVLILYGVLQGKKRWEAYRKYAWIGFFGNYIFLGTAILAILLTGVLYPIDDVKTYLADLSEAELLSIHPSGQEVGMNVTQLEESLFSFEREHLDAVQWYEDIREQKRPSEEYINPESVQEKFPYLLTGVGAQAGKEVRIYVESDGKGLLITTKDHQYYFRSDTASFLEERGNEE